MCRLSRGACGTITPIAVLKSLLESEGIAHYFHGERFNALIPSAQPVKLMVDKRYIGKLKDLIRGLNLG